MLLLLLPLVQFTILFDEASKLSAGTQVCGLVAAHSPALILPASAMCCTHTPSMHTGAALTFSLPSPLSTASLPPLQVRMHGVQIGAIKRVSVDCELVTAVAEVSDSHNIIPRGSRVDINFLGLASDPFVDITPPAGCEVKGQHGPHHSKCAAEGQIVCAGAAVEGQLGGSFDYMMKFYLSQQDRTRVRTVDQYDGGAD